MHFPVYPPTDCAFTSTNFLEIALESSNVASFANVANCKMTAIASNGPLNIAEHFQGYQSIPRTPPIVILLKTMLMNNFQMSWVKQKQDVPLWKKALCGRYY